MIQPSSIDAVRYKADLTEIVGLYETVKRQGTTHTACCPFHSEKSPSFHIYKSERYKCYGCGVSGDVFKFIQEKEKKTFFEAVQWLAEHYNITLEYDNQTKEEAQQAKDLRTEALASVAWAARRYAKTLQDLPANADAILYLESRGYTKEKREKWDMGFAPSTHKFLTSPLIEAGKHTPSVEVGLLTVKDGNTFDFFFKRIMIPLHDVNGTIIGLAGRTQPDFVDGKWFTNKNFGKYLNPKESILYSKAKYWYGLWQAQRAIKDRGMVYITEGYLDVQAMHDAGIDNTVASSGTEIDILQAKMLKRYCNHVCLCYDGDKPGLDKMMKNIDTFLKLDFKVEVVELPDGKDPFDYFNTKEFITAQKVEVLENIEQAVEDGAFAD